MYAVFVNFQLTETRESIFTTFPIISSSFKTFLSFKFIKSTSRLLDKVLFEISNQKQNPPKIN